MENLIFVINVVLPVFILVIVGYILKLSKLIDEVFIQKTSSFVYNISLPVLIFMKLYNVDINKAFDLKMILLVLSGILVTLLIGILTEKPLKLEPASKGVFVQGTFRSNYVIVGLAIISRMYGAESLAKASFLLLFALPLYNLLSVVVLTLPFHKFGPGTIKQTMYQIILNPLVIAVLLAIPFSLFQIPLAKPVATTANYLASIALPIALVGIGGTLELKKAIRASGAAMISSFVKIVLSPLIIVIMALLWDIKGEDLGILFIVFACPTAIASFVMAAGMKGNIKMAGNIVIISTLGSVFSLIVGLFLLKQFALI